MKSKLSKTSDSPMIINALSPAHAGFDNLYCYLFPALTYYALFCRPLARAGNKLSRKVRQAN